MSFKEVFLIIALIVTINAEYKSYRNYKVYKTVPGSEKEVEFFKELDRSGWFFWTDKLTVGGDVRVMVAPDKQKEYEDNLTKAGISSRVLIEDVQKLIDDQVYRPANASRQIGDYAWTHYQSLDEINAWLDDIVARHSDVATIVTIGQSVEGRDIRGVIIDYQKHESSNIAMVEGGLHAREWISPATVTWIIKEFLESNDPDVRDLAESFEWHIFPVVNPDGYVYTFTNNRMWRKNRNKANHISCAWEDDMSNGVDLNRNFGYLWNTIGASSNPCGETFAGPVAFSEPESLAIANHVSLLQQRNQLVYYFAFHSFSQMLLMPYSHVGGANVLQVGNYGDLYEIAIKGVDKLHEKHNISYTVGTSVDILYPVSGSSFDWVYGSARVPIVYLFELRDLGQFGFLLPRDQIIPNNEEVMAALIEMDRLSRKMGYGVIAGSNASRVGLSAVLLVFYTLGFF